MKKSKIEIRVDDFPKELHYLFKNASVYDSSCNPNAQVLYSDLGYYVKITEGGELMKEAAMTDMFADRGMGVEVVSYISKEKDFIVTRSAKVEA